MQLSSFVMLKECLFILMLYFPFFIIYRILDLGDEMQKLLKWVSLVSD